MRAERRRVTSKASNGERNNADPPCSRGPEMEHPLLSLDFPVAMAGRRRVVAWSRLIAWVHGIGLGATRRTPVHRGGALQMPSLLPPAAALHIIAQPSGHAVSQQMPSTQLPSRNLRSSCTRRPPERVIF